MKVLELMKSHVISLTAEASLLDAVDMFDLYQVTLLPIVDGEERLLGVVTQNTVSDRLLPLLLSSLASGDTKSASLLRETPITDFMMPAIAAEQEEDAAAAAERMLQADIQRLPVMEAGRLRGILSRNDLCQAWLDGTLTAATSAVLPS